jgi:putative peptidoglycan lipid II flippase
MTAPDAESAGQRQAARVLRSTGVVGGMTLVSRIFGLVRDVVFARIFGAGLGMDAFFIANKIPNLLRRFFAEGAFAQAFVPVFTDYRSTREREEVRALADAVAGVLGLVLFAVTAVGVVAAPAVVLVVAPGFAQDGGRFELASDMLRWTFPYLAFVSLTALAGGILNAHRRFAVPAFTPVLLNLVLIAAALWLAPRFERPEMALAVGVFVAGLVQLAFQLPALAAIGMLPRPRLDFRSEGVQRIRRLMLPALLGSSVAQINVLFDNMIASFLQPGSVSWLYYSDRLMEFPLGVFGIALATVILPGLSEHHARKSPEAFSATLDFALRLVLVIGVPAAAALIVLATPLIATIFYGGEFTAEDVAMSAASLAAYAVGLLGFILVKVLAPGYYARQDTRTPVRVAIVALVCNMVLNVVFVVALLRGGYAAPHAGLAAATSIAACLNAALLARGLTREGHYRPGAGWGRLALQVGIATAVMSGGLAWVAHGAGDWLAWPLAVRIGWLAAAVPAGAAVYFAVLFLGGFRYRTLHAGSA